MSFFRKTALILCLVAAGGAGIAKEYFRTDFKAPSHATGWRLDNRGDGSGKFSRAEGSGNRSGALMITAGTNDGWIFAVRNIPATELGNSPEVEVKVNVMTNRPMSFRVDLAEGTEYGGLCRYLHGGTTKHPFRWEQITYKFKRKDFNGLLSFAVGFGYKASGAWAIVDSVVISDVSTDAVLIKADYPVLLDARELNQIAVAQLAEVTRLEAINPGLKKQHNMARDIQLLQEALDCGQTAPHTMFAEVARIQQEYQDSDCSLEVTDSMREFTAATPVAGSEREYLIALLRESGDGILHLIRNNSQEARNYILRYSGDAAKFAKIYRLNNVKGTPDLPREVASGDYIHAGSGETVGILVQFDTAGVDPGERSGLLQIQPFGSRKELQVKHRVRVAKYAAPVEMPIPTCYWVCPGDPLRERIFIDIKGNIIHAVISRQWPTDLEKDSDLTALKNTLDTLKTKYPERKFTFLVEVFFHRYAGGWKAEYAPYYQQLIAKLKSFGLNYDQFYLSLYDEELPNDYALSIQKIREFEPRIRFFSDYLDSDKELETFLPLLDVWCPLLHCFPPESTVYQQQLTRIKAEPKAQLWSYICDIESTHPVSLYRKMGYLLFMHDLNGVCMWSATLDPLPLHSDQAADYGLFYQDYQGNVIYSRRLLQWKTGLDDYLMLTAAAKMDGPVRALVEQAKTEYRRAYMLPEFGAVANSWRNRIIEAMDRN